MKKKVVTFMWYSGDLSQCGFKAELVTLGEFKSPVGLCAGLISIPGSTTELQKQQQKKKRKRKKKPLKIQVIKKVMAATK